MLRNCTSRFVSLISSSNTTSKIVCPCPERFYSKNINEDRIERMFNDQQATYYTAKDVEFCPNRAKEVMQNNVEGVSENALNEEPFPEVKKYESAAPSSEADHMEAYRADNSVSLYSVMQSNVPEPFNSQQKAPTNLNMPGSSSTKDYKYLSGKMQSTHHSRQ